MTGRRAGEEEEAGERFRIADRGGAGRAGMDRLEVHGAGAVSHESPAPDPARDRAMSWILCLIGLGAILILGWLACVRIATGDDQ
jgi:hypothetical protein